MKTKFVGRKKIVLKSNFLSQFCLPVWIISPVNFPSCPCWLHVSDGSFQTSFPSLPPESPSVEEDGRHSSWDSCFDSWFGHNPLVTTYPTHIMRFCPIQSIQSSRLSSPNHPRTCLENVLFPFPHSGWVLWRAVLTGWGSGYTSRCPVSNRPSHAQPGFKSLFSS